MIVTSGRGSAVAVGTGVLVAEDGYVGSGAFEGVCEASGGVGVKLGWTVVGGEVQAETHTPRTMSAAGRERAVAERSEQGGEP